VELLLIPRVARALDEALRDAVVRSFRQESDHRYRLVAEAAAGPRSLVISLAAESPWVGRPIGVWEGPRWSPGPLASAIGPHVTGEFVGGVDQGYDDRILRIRFRDGSEVVAELARHRAALAWVDRDGVVVRAHASPRVLAERLRPGASYHPPETPRGRLHPLRSAAPEIDEAVGQGCRDGLTATEAFRRAVFGVGADLADLLVREAEAARRTIGGILAARRLEILEGRNDPVVVGPEDLRAALDGNRFDPSRFRLLPWDPGESVAPGVRARREDAAATAGSWHEALERSALARSRHEGLRAILRRELDRVVEAERRAESDARRFEDPALHRSRGEALLAGLSVVRRDGEDFVVPDPRNPGGPPIRVPALAGRPPHEAAAEEFRKARRAERGTEAARARSDALARRRIRLEAIETGDAGALAQAMRLLGLPVDLTPGSAQQRRVSKVSPPRLEGVRMRTSRDGYAILVGKSGKENDRLTFKIAAPDDFWLHARGVPGAHVVIRNPDRRPSPPRATLEEAAAFAAWFSDARREAAVDVQWTRRKFVRRVRGAPGGTVVVKRFEILRVKPAPPEPGDEGES
jgi:predicted ribosome quality control (RQC) complex YloA/Tae2 family protein